VRRKRDRFIFCSLGKELRFCHEKINLSRFLCLAVLTCVALLLFSSLAIATSVAKDPCDDVLLPEHVRQLLVEKFPKWRALKLFDLSRERQDLWFDSKKRDSCPGIATGNFETKVRLSYALVLIPITKDQPGFKFVVVNVKESSINFNLLYETDRPANYPVIYRVPPGKYLDWQRISSVQLSLDGIQLEQMEVRAILYYWKNGHYNELVVMD
jgi:hypothetical protein